MNTAFDVRSALDEVADDTPPPPVGMAENALRRARRRRYAVRGTVAGIAVAVAVPGTLAIASQTNPFGSTFEPASPSNAAAQHAASDPRHLLLDDPAWQMIYADTLAQESGEIAMTDGERQFELRWWPGDQHESVLNDRRFDAEGEKAITLLGHDAVLFDGESDVFYTVWRDGDFTIEARGDYYGDVDHFLSVLGLLHEADEDSWHAALPDDTVFAEDRADVVSEMLRDIPTPDDFDSSAIATEEVAEGRYHVGAMVTRSVMCAWVDEWITAAESGDERAATTAVEAITSAYDWSILLEMEPQGGWSQGMWDGADVFADGLSPTEVAELYGSKEQAADSDPPLDVYRAPFGCDQ